MATCQVLKDEFLTCIICHEVFRDPVTLHCGHTLCAQCVTGYTKTQKEAIKQGCIACPHCRGMTKVPDPKKSVEEWAKQLKTGFFVQGLVEKFALESKDDNCSLCQDDGETKPANVWCSVCGHALCTDCQTVHRKLHKDHDVTNLSGESRKSVRESKRLVCDKHPEYVIDLLCEDCDLAICQRCCTLHHRKCQSVILLADALSKFDPVLKEYKKQVDSEVADVQSELSSIQTSEEKLLFSAVKAETDIGTACETLISSIRKQQKQLKDELNRRKTETLQNLRGDLKSGEMRLEEVKQRQSFIEHALKSTNSHTRYEAYRLFPKSMMNVSEVVSSPKYYEEYIFDDKTDKSFNLGGIQSRNRTLRIKPRKILTVETGFSNISGITVMYPNGIKTIVVAHSISQCIKSFTEKDNDRARDVSTLNASAQPFSVTRITDTKAATSLYMPKRILFFSVKPQLKTESVIGTRKHYVFLTYLGSTTMAASTHFPGSIDIIDMSGGILQSFGNNILINPRYISAGQNSCLLISDIVMNKLISLTCSGEPRFIIEPTKPVKTSYKGVCQSTEGEVFVVDSTANKVIELTETGIYVREVLTGADGITMPGLIFLDGNMMYISEGNWIHVYQYRK